MNVVIRSVRTFTEQLSARRARGRAAIQRDRPDALILENDTVVGELSVDDTLEVAQVGAGLDGRELLARVRSRRSYRHREWAC